MTAAPVSGCRCCGCAGKPPQWARDLECMWDEDVRGYIWILSGPRGAGWRLVVIDETNAGHSGRIEWDHQTLEPAGWTTQESGALYEYTHEDDRDKARRDSMADLVAHFVSDPEAYA